MKRLRERGTAIRYAIAVGAVAVAAVVTWALSPSFSVALFPFFFLAVVIGSTFGGIGPGLLSTALSAAALEFLFIAPGGVGWSSRESLIRISVFLVIALVVNWISEAADRARGLAVLRGRELEITLASIGDAVIASDSSGRITFINRAAERLTGWSDGEIHGRDCDAELPLISEETREKLESPVARVISESVTTGFANRTLLIARDGTEIPVAGSAAPIVDSGGRILGAVLVISDAREERKARRRERVQSAVSRLLAESRPLEESSEELLRVICEEIGWIAGEFGVEDQGTIRILEFSSRSPDLTAAFEDIARKWRFKPGEGVTGRVLETRSAVWVPDVQADSGFPRALSANQAGIHGGFGVPILFDDRILGSLSFYSDRLEERDDQLLAVMQSLGAQIGQFIQRRRAEAALRDSEELHRLITGAASDAILTIDQSGCIVFANPAAGSLFGYAPDELVGRDLNVLVPEEYRSRDTTGLQRYIETGEKRMSWERIRFPGLRRDGTRMEMEISLGELDRGGMRFFTAVARDVTERERFIAERERLTRQFELLMDSTSEGIYGTDLDGRCTFINSAGARMLGYPPEELIGRNMHELVHHTRKDGRAYPESECPLTRALSSREPDRADHEVLWKKDGTWFYVQYTANPIVENDRLRGAVVTFLDNTEQRLYEQELRNRETQQSVIAHLGTRAVTGIDVDTLMQESVKKIAETFDVGFAKILELLADGRFLVKAGVGWKPGLVGNLVVPAGERSQAGYAVLTKAPVIVENLEDEKRFEDPTMLEEHGVVSGLSVVIEGEEGPYGVLSVHSREPRRFSEDDISFLQSVANIVGEATERKRRELLVIEQRRWLEATLSGIGDAVVATDAAGVIVFINPIAERLSGWSRLYAVGQRLRRVFDVREESDGKAVGDLIEMVKQKGEPFRYRGDLVLRSVDGQATPVDVSGSPLRDPTGTIVGIVMVFRDIAERRRNEREKTALTLQIEAERERLVNIVANVPGVVWEAWGAPDRATQKINFVSNYVESMLGYSVDEWLSTENFWLKIVHPEDRERAAAEAAAKFRSGRGGTSEFRWMTKDGRAIWVEATSVPIPDEKGNSIGLRGVTLDVTARKEAEQERLRLLENERKAREQAEVERARSAFLAEVSTELAGSLDYRVTLGKTARLTVPRIADWCAIDVLDDDGLPQRLALEHTDPDKLALVREIEQRYPPAPGAETGVPGVLRSGRSEVYPAIDDAMLKEAARDEKHLELLRALGFRSAMIVPLIARDRTLGAITLVTAESDRHYGRDDLSLAEEMARRAALAVDNARLYAVTQQANRAKDEFLATLSHELRTPMTSILGWARMMNMGELDEETQMLALETIERSASAQAQMIEDLLDVSRIVRGRLHLEMKPVRLDRVIASAIETVKPAAEAKDVTLRTELDEEAGDVIGDDGRLHQVIWNLLSNAIKFAPKGGWIETRLERVESVARVSVSDNGVGIPQQFLPYVFERFRQAESSTTRSYGGLGLGLAIVRHLVELHGGTVSASSEGEGKGATFTIELPIMAVQLAEALAGGEGTAEHEPESEPGVEMPELDSMRVLVVDDEPDARKLISTVLERGGADVRSAPSAAEGLEAFRRWRPDVLVSDIAMPGEDGFALLKGIRENGGETIPAIALTAYGRPDDERRILEAGFDTYLRKPVEPTRLAWAVARFRKAVR
ncbi:MAG: PAS domain S-box protein [Thermoanaerobaculia bacterium]